MGFEYRTTEQAALAIAAHFGSDDSAWLEPMKPEKLAPLDQFHLGGIAGTLELAKAADIQPAQRVLDIGCGVGGPARILTSQFEAEVTGVDISPQYCELAYYLNEITNVNFEIICDDAARIELPSQSFDVIWTQSSTISMPDKDRLFSMISRVAKPGAVFAAHDVTATSGSDIHLPTPWADSDSENFLDTESQYQKRLTDNGWAIESVEDHTDAVIDFVAERMMRKPKPNDIGLGLIVDDFADKFANVRRNLAEGLIGFVQIIARKS